MKAMQSAKSSITERSHSKLGFRESISVPLAYRDYGMIRITHDRSSTPYPRVSQGVDADTLRKRLFHQRHSKMEPFPLTSESNYAVHLDEAANQKATMEIPEHLLSGTPHPKKGTAVDPKMLLKHLETNKLTSDLTMRRSTYSITRSIGRNKSDQQMRSFHSEFQSIGTQHPKKGIVANRKNLVKRLSNDNLVPKGKKRVTILSPLLSVTSFCNSVNSQDSPNIQSDQPQLTFAERRRLFHMAEFTITKGKKLCEIPMLTPQHQTDIDCVYHRDEIAQKEIETFIKTQGYTKVLHNTLTGVRSSSPYFGNTPQRHSFVSHSSEVILPMGFIKERFSISENSSKLSQFNINSKTKKTKIKGKRSNISLATRRTITFEKNSDGASKS